jgi:hypothetical protein
MSRDPNLPAEVREVLRKGLLNRLPLTFLPFINQHLRDWEYLFPFEQGSVTGLLLHLGGLNEEQLTDLFRPLQGLEARMGVRHWQFDTREQTIENASLLARSPYYQQWRREVQNIFDQVESRAPSSEAQTSRRDNRLVLLILPRRLPFDPAKVWKRWQEMGKVVRIDRSNSGEGPSLLERLLAAEPGGGSTPGLFDVLCQRSRRANHEVWFLDAGAELAEALLSRLPPGGERTSPTLLSFDRLKSFRDQFSEQMNAMRKDLADADAVYSRLRKVNVTPWCPPEVASQPVIREFLRSVFLNGNGAVIFGNSFVEWGASEALRRARPSVLVAHFGIRFKPKPFTSAAVFENQELANPAAPVEDIPGSALDAQMLALYVWLAAGRYPEYHRQTACLCFAENLSQAYVVAPPEFPLWKEGELIAPERVRSALRSWLA